MYLEIRSLKHWNYSHIDIYLYIELRSVYLSVVKLAIHARAKSFLFVSWMTPFQGIIVMQKQSDVTLG